jgi:hypothetical protein
MPITAAMSRSAALTAIPSSRIRQASFTTGKNIISTISFSGKFTSCAQVHFQKDYEIGERRENYTTLQNRVQKSERERERETLGSMVTPEMLLDLSIYFSNSGSGLASIFSL